MNIELRNLKSVAAMSEETTCFTADIYIDGKRAGVARNSGRGEPTLLRFDDHNVARRFEQFCEALPPVDISLPWQPPLSVNMDAELYIDQLVETALRDRKLQRLARKSLVFRTQDQPVGEWHVLSRAYSPEEAAELRRQHGAALVEIYNERKQNA